MNVGPHQIALVYAIISALVWFYALIIASTALLNRWKWSQYRWLFVVSIVMLAFSVIFAVYFVPLL